MCHRTRTRDARQICTVFADIYDMVRGILLGVVLTVVSIALGAYLFIVTGGVPVSTGANPLPFEAAVARLALHAGERKAGTESNPLPATDQNFEAGARSYSQSCAICHGLPRARPTAIAAGMFPRPPQLFTPDDMVTDDPEGVTYWKVTNGIRLSGMPAFGKALADAERWQLTMLLKNADHLPPAVDGVLTASTN